MGCGYRSMRPRFVSRYAWRITEAAAESLRPFSRDGARPASRREALRLYRGEPLVLAVNWHGRFLRKRSNELLDAPGLRPHSAVQRDGKTHHYRLRFVLLCQIRYGL